VKAQPKESILRTLQERLASALGIISLMILILLTLSGCKFSDLDLHVKDGDLGRNTGSPLGVAPVPPINSIP
jgi:hypothetical protein